MRDRIKAIIHYNTDRHGARRRTGAFDVAEFVKLLADVERQRQSGRKDYAGHYYVIYPAGGPGGGEELRLFLHEVERIELLG